VIEVLLVIASGIAGFLVGSYVQRKAAKRTYLAELHIEVLPDLLVANLYRPKILTRAQRLGRLSGRRVKRALNALSPEDPAFLDKVVIIQKTVERKLNLTETAPPSREGVPGAHEPS
jgi:hypothetical protein